MLPNEILAQAKQLREAAETMESLARQQAELDMRLAAAQAVLRPSAAPPSLAVQPLITGFPNGPDLPDLTPPAPPIEDDVTGSITSKRFGRRGGNYPEFASALLEWLKPERVITGSDVYGSPLMGCCGVPNTIDCIHGMLRTMWLNGLLEKVAWGKWKLKVTAPTPES